MSIYKKSIIAIFLIGLGLGERIFFNLGPNVELVTLSSFLASCYLGLPFAVIVPTAIMFISDSIIGNTEIVIFTWSAYALIGLTGLLLRRFKDSGLKLSLFSIPCALATSLFFYLWTNFGVWYQGWYPPTLQGLLTSYIMGLPFLKYNLFGNLIFVPVGFTLVELSKIFLSGPINLAFKKLPYLLFSSPPSIQIKKQC